MNSKHNIIAWYAFNTHTLKLEHLLTNTHNSTLVLFILKDTGWLGCLTRPRLSSESYQNLQIDKFEKDDQVEKIPDTFEDPPFFNNTSIFWTPVKLLQNLPNIVKLLVGGHFEQEKLKKS